MAENSRSCKLWCVTLESAVSFFVARSGNPEHTLIALVPGGTRGIGQNQGELSESPCSPASDSVSSPREHLLPLEFGIDPPATP